MKKNIFITKLFGVASLFLLIFSISCSEDYVEYADGGYQTITDPFLQIDNPVVAFQAGIAEYPIEFNVINGDKRISKVNVYSVFTDAESGLQSDQVLLASYAVSDPIKEVMADALTYDRLKTGVTVDGKALPASDVDLKVGSGWRLTFSGEQADGTVVPLAGSMNVSVLSRFAGVYRVLESKYFRIMEDRDDVIADNGTIGSTRFIGSVDETTFSYNDYIGTFANTGAFFTFRIDFADNSITIPLEDVYPGGWGTYTTNCDDNPGDLTNVPCDTGNILIPDDVSGKHRLILVYGYYTEGSGPREFYELLEKVVD